MKTTRLFLLAALAAGIFTTQILYSQVNWSGADLPNGNLNWSDAANWSGGTPSGSAVVFPDGAFPVTTNVVGAVNNIVDTSMTISSLAYKNVTPLIGTPVHVVTTFINAAQILTVNGAVTVGALTNTTVNLAGTNCAFIMNSSSSTFGVGSSGSEQAILTLCDGTNIITAGTVSVGTSGSSNGKTCVVNLGNGTNVIDANAINLGSGKASATVQFAGSSGSLTIANAAGTGRATILMGSGTASGSASCVGQLLLTGHPVNVLAGTVTFGAESSSGTGNQQGKIQFDNGVFDATSILMAAMSGSGSGSSSTGTLTVGGSVNTATLIVNSPSGPGGGSCVLSDSTVAHPSTGTLNINTNGAAQINTSITKATAANNTGTINVTGGALTVTNGTIGTAAIPVDNLNITNATLSLDIPVSGAAATVSILNLGGATNIIGVNSIDATVLGYPAVLQLIKYNSASGTNAFNVGLGTLPVGFTGIISNDVANSAVDLVVTGGPAPPRNILWSGRDANNGNATTSVWDINNTKDWLSNSVPVTYNDNGGQGGDIVVFDDTAATGVVTLHTTVSPTAITVTNNTLSYTINDGNNGYALAGSTSLTKRGTQKLTLDNSGGVSLGGGVDLEDGGTLQIGNGDTGGGLGSCPVTDNGSLIFSRNNSSLAVSNTIGGGGSVADNDGTGTLTLAGLNTFSGAVTVASGGVLQIGNNSALGATNSGTTIANGAALDVNGHNVGQESITVSGTGPDSTKGAIYNSGTNVFPAIARLTLAGDTTLGGPVNSANFGRWDLRSANINDANGASLTVPNVDTKLTKVGANVIAISGVTIDTNLGDIDIQGGILSIEEATTGLGDPSRTLTVENGAQLSIFSATNLFNKNIALMNNSILDNSSGNNTVIGPITLGSSSGDTVSVNFRNTTGGSVGGSLTLSNMIGGAGSLIKNDTNTLVLAGANSYSGTTTVNDGTLQINGINSNPNNVLTENTTQTSATVPVVVCGNGTNIGPVDIEDTLWPGNGGRPSTFGAGSGPGNDYPGSDGTLAFGALEQGTPTVIFDLNSTTTVGGGVNDLININGDFEGGFAHVKINPLGMLNTNGPYTLVTYTGSKGGNFNGSVQTLTSGSRYGFTLNYPAGAVTLSVNGGPVLLTWNNHAGTGIWDVQSSQNWFNSSSLASDVFYNSDTVVLDDSILSAPTPTTSINLTATVSPASITNNSSSANYTISGSGKITGSTGLVKRGSSTLTIATTNDFTGGVNINGGFFVPATANAPGIGVISFGGGTLQYPASGNTVDYSPHFSSATGQLYNINVPAGAQATFASPLTSSNCTFTLNDQNNSGTLVVSATNTFTGSIIVSNGTLRANNANSFNGNPIIEAANAVAVGGITVYHNSAGTYTDNYTINGFGVAETDPNATHLGAIRMATSGINLAGTITLNGDAGITSRSSGLVGDTISGQITGNYGIRFNRTTTSSGTGGGTIILNNTSNNWTGDTTIADGILKLGASGVIPSGTGFGNVIMTNAGANFNAGISNTVFDLNGFNQTINGLSHATNGGDASQLGYLVITNGGSSPVTLTVGNNNASGVYGGAIANGANALSLTKIGSGIEILSGVNTYTGNTAINGGTLALSGAGSIGNSPHINIAGNAMLDVSSLSSSFVLGASQTLGNSSSTAVLNGSASTSSGTVSLTFASGIPSLMVTNGTLTLSASTTFKVNNAGVALTVGNYTVISRATTGNVGSVAGIAPASVTVSGGGLAAGTTATLQISGGQLNLVVSANTPSMPHITGINLNGTTLSIAATNGSANGNWTLLQSTNVALPLLQWQTNLAGTFDSNGNLSTNIANTVSNSQEFYILKQ